MSYSAFAIVAVVIVGAVVLEAPVCNADTDTDTDTDTGEPSENSPSSLDHRENGTRLTNMNTETSGGSPSDALAAAEFDRGEVLFEEMRYEEAAAAFGRAYALKPHPSVLVNRGLSLEKAGDTVAAYKIYKDCIALESLYQMPDWLQERHARLREYLVHLVIDCRMESCRIELDGRDLGIPPASAVVKPGIHTAEAFVGDRRIARVARQFEKGENLEVLLVGSVPIDKPPVVFAPPPSEKSLHAGRVLGPGFWVSAGVTVAAGLTATVFGARTLNDKSLYESTEGPADNIREQGKRDKAVTNVMLGVTLAGAAATGIFAAVDIRRWKAAESSRVRVSPGAVSADF